MEEELGPLIGVMMMVMVVGMFAGGVTPEPEPPEPPEPPDPPEPGKANLYGRVSDSSTGAPIASANVTLNGLSTATDAQGDYVFLDRVLATYAIGFSKDGYEPLATQVTLIEGNNELNVLLAATAPLVFDPWIYDLNGDGYIDEAERQQATQDYHDGIITYDQLMQVLNLPSPPTPAPGFYWLCPSGYNDPENRWYREECAIDGWEDTYAETDRTVGPKDWSPPIVLTILSTEVSAIRWKWGTPVTPITMDIDLYYSGAWHDVYDGKEPSGECIVPGGSQMITKARISMLNPSRSVAVWVKLYDFKFYGVASAPPGVKPPCPGIPTTKLFGNVTDASTGQPISGASGTVYQDKGTKTQKYPFTTNEQGHYLIDNMQYDVDATLMSLYATGYTTYTKEDISISEGDNQLDISMSRVAAQVAALELSPIIQGLIATMVVGVVAAILIPKGAR